MKPHHHPVSHKAEPPHSAGRRDELKHHASPPSAKGYSGHEPAGDGPHLSTVRDLWVSDAKVHGGAPVLTGTTVRLETLIEYRLAGAPLYEFLVDFPTVRRSLAKRVWAWMARHSPTEIRAALKAAGARPGPAVEPPRKPGHSR